MCSVWQPCTVWMSFFILNVLWGKSSLKENEPFFRIIFIPQVKLQLPKTSKLHCNCLSSKILFYKLVYFFPPKVHGFIESERCWSQQLLCKISYSVSYQEMTWEVSFHPTSLDREMTSQWSKAVNTRAVSSLGAAAIVQGWRDVTTETGKVALPPERGDLGLHGQGRDGGLH